MPPKKRYKSTSARIKKPSLWQELSGSYGIRAVISLMILLSIVTIVGIAADYLVSRKMSIDVGRPDHFKQSKPQPAPADRPDNFKQPKPQVAPVIKVPVYEVFPPPEAAPAVDNTRPSSPLSGSIKHYPLKKTHTLPQKHSRPDVVIIIDDIGYSSKIVDQFLSIGLPLTFSVLPFSPQQKRIIKKIHDKKCEIMLHLPMEPVEYPRIDPGPGALLTSMTPGELTAHLDKALDAIPQAAGVNNHMGSKLTVDAEQMYRILSVIKQRHLFFIDSRTANKNVSRRLARNLKLPYAQRTVFLDNNLSVSKIRNQLLELVELAKQRGSAIGIGHPHAETFQVLAQELPRLKKEIHIVPASKLVHIIG